MLFGYLWSLGALAAPAREIIHKVTPDYPDEDLACEVTLDVAADGAVAIQEIKRCKRHAELVSAALARWRYAPAPEATVEEVSLSHARGQRHDVQVWSEPAWASEEEREAGSSCVAHAWIDTDGRINEIEVMRCDDPAKTRFLDAVVRWRFDERDAPWDGYFVARSWTPERPVQKRIFPTFPPEATESDARCMVFAIVSAAGVPEVEDVVACPDTFASAAAAAVAQWRWEPQSAPWPTTIGITFRKN